MKKLQLFLLTVGLICICTTTANATIYTFNPTPRNLGNLDHSSFYTWGIRWTPQPNEIIVRARLVIQDINNWADEDNILYMHLLKNAPDGVRVHSDDVGGDNFANWPIPNILLDTYTDSDPNSAEDYRYRFNNYDLRHLNRWAQDGNFGFGFDPDCHYWNNGVRFIFETRVIPEPATMSLFGIGLLGLARKLRKKNS